MKDAAHSTRCVDPPIPDAGVYVAVFRLARARRIRVGRLGEFRFPAGYYLYAGSAQRHLEARLDRHARADKPPHWHVDYLSAEAEMIGALVAPGPKSRECELAAELADRFALAVPRFGASDCRCPGHLAYTEHLP
ncbi:MAG: GIY-YIG nuclease family protein [Planctomycetota bacterium]